MLGHSLVGGISNGSAPHFCQSRRGAQQLPRRRDPANAVGDQILIERADIDRPPCRGGIPGAISGLVLPRGDIVGGGVEWRRSRPARRVARRPARGAATTERSRRGDGSSCHQNASRVEKQRRVAHLYTHATTNRRRPPPPAWPRGGKTPNRRQHPQARKPHPRRHQPGRIRTGRATRSTCTVHAMGQSVEAKIDVEETKVHCRVMLPGILSLFAGPIESDAAPSRATTCCSRITARKNEPRVAPRRRHRLASRSR